MEEQVSVCQYQISSGLVFGLDNDHLRFGSVKNILALSSVKIKPSILLVEWSLESPSDQTWLCLVEGPALIFQKLDFWSVLPKDSSLRIQSAFVWSVFLVKFWFIRNRKGIFAETYLKRSERKRIASPSRVSPFNANFSS